MNKMLLCVSTISIILSGCSTTNSTQSKKDAIKVVVQSGSITPDRIIDVHSDTQNQTKFLVKKLDGKRQMGNENLLTLQIIQPAEPGAKAQTIASLDYDLARTAVLNGNKLYYVDANKSIAYFSLNESFTSPLPFVRLREFPSKSFLVNDAGTQIAWSENISGAKKSMVSTLYSANIDGTNKKTLKEGSFTDSRVIVPLKWISDDVLLTGEEITSQSGYLPFGAEHEKRERITISKNTKTTTDEEYLSPDDSWSMLFHTLDKKVSIDLNYRPYKKKYEIPTPEDSDFQLGGNVHFSPNSKFVTYELSTGDPSREVKRTFLVEVGSTHPVPVLQIPEDKKLSVIGWVNNSLLLVGDQEHLYTMEPGSTSLTKISL